MARQQFITFISLLLLSSTLLLSNAFDDEKEAPNNRIEVVVEGIVYCQSCTSQGTWSLTDAKPIPSAKVSVTCNDHKDRVTFYKVFVTNGDGYFYGQLDGFKMDHYILDHPLHSCFVRVVSSPLSQCNTPANINYGLNGGALRYEDKRLFRDEYEAVVYAAGPFAFRPSHCF